jgi:hypothetical protein
VHGADLDRLALHHGLAERHLAVAGEGALAAMADGEDGGVVELGMGHLISRPAGAEPEG